MTGCLVLLINVHYKASLAGMFIDNGTLGLCGNHKYYILGTDLDILYNMLTFKIFDIVIHYTKYGQDFLDKDSFTYIPDIRKLGNVDDISEKQFYEMIKLNENEIKMINGKKEKKTKLKSSDEESEDDYENDTDSEENIKVIKTKKKTKLKLSKHNSDVPNEKKGNNVAKKLKVAKNNIKLKSLEDSEYNKPKKGKKVIRK